MGEAKVKKDLADAQELWDAAKAALEGRLTESEAKAKADLDAKRKELADLEEASKQKLDEVLASKKRELAEQEEELQRVFKKTIIEKDEIIEQKNTIIRIHEEEMEYIRSKQDVARCALEQASFVQEEFSATHAWRTHFLQVFQIAFMVCEGIGLKPEETDSYKRLLEKEARKRQVREDMERCSRNKSTSKKEMAKLREKALALGILKEEVGQAEAAWYTRSGAV